MAPLAMISERPSSVRSMVKPKKMSSTTPFSMMMKRGVAWI